MNERKTIHSKVSRIGPMIKIEGGLIFQHPFKSSALKGYDSNTALTNSEPFINKIIELASTWYDKFPNCCETHKEITKLGNFDKKNFDFIPNQILNNVKYFSHALETLIIEENGINDAKDYLDYLLESFGKPEIGGQVFRNVITYFIENGTLDKNDFTDDQRLELLEHLEPTKPPIDLSERDFDSLYQIFQDWIEAIPNIGRFIEIKTKFKGKVPMNMFLLEPKTNKYLGTFYSKTRSKNELLELLYTITNEVLVISKEEVKKENYSNENLILAAEERLRIKQEKLLTLTTNDIELDYRNLIENWLTNTIEFYQVLNLAFQESNNKNTSETVKKIDLNLNNALSSIESLYDEVKFISNSENILEWLKDSSFEELLKDFEKTNNKNDDVILEKINDYLKSSNKINIKEFEKKVNNPQLSVKHKIKISIPLFLFTRYESEVELSEKLKIPKTFKDFKKMLF